MSEWITNAIINQHIQQYEYSEFENVTNFAEGGFAYVKCADWPCSERKVALKRIKKKKYDVRKFVEEVKIHSSGHSSEYVVRFFGLTKESPDNNIYMMVMEFAELKSLRNFLSQEDVKINWEIKYNLSLDIAKGLNCLHSRNIAHRDLHAHNIVIKRVNTCCQPKFIAKITDFGEAVSMNGGNNEGEGSEDPIIGQIAFLDPKTLSGSHKRDLSSDIYSIGVIFWEISSGKMPFKSYMPNDNCRDTCLTLAIMAGLRETPTPSTPENYSSLYQNCWKYEPSERPKINQIIDTLNTGLTEFLEQTHELKDNDIDLNTSTQSGSDLVNNFWSIDKSDSNDSYNELFKRPTIEQIIINKPMN